MTDVELENLLHQHIQGYKDKISDLEETVALWKGIHEGTVIAMQVRIKALEEALDDALGEWEGAQDWMSPHDKMVAAESISAYRKMLRRE